MTAQPPMMCLTCDSEFTREAMPEAWVLMHAHRNEPEKALGNGICAACHARYPGAALLPVVLCTSLDPTQERDERGWPRVTK